MKKIAVLLCLTPMLLFACSQEGGGKSSSQTNSIESEASSISSSANASSEAVPVTMTDMSGRSLTVTPGSYKRIVCVGAGALRLYSYVGDLGLLAGVEDIDNPTARANGSGKYFEGVPRPYYDANKEIFDKLPSCGVGGPMNQAPELEKLISCNPDLIISEYNAEAATSMENATDALVFNVSYGGKAVFDDNCKQSIEKLGQLLGKEERSKELLDYIKDAETELAGGNDASTTAPRAYVGGVGNWGSRNYLATHFSYPMFEAAGVTNVLTDSGITGAGQSSIDKEAFATLAPQMDIMILDAAGLSLTLSDYQTDSTIFNGVKAVTDSNVFIQLPYNVYYTNLEIALINAYWAGWAAYPNSDLYKDFSIKEKADEIFTIFNGKPLYDIEVALPNAYGGYQKVDDLNKWMQTQLG